MATSAIGPAAELGGAGLGMLQGSKANSAQEAAARQAQQQQQQLINRQSGLFDTILGNVQGADRSGAFDPTQRINDLSKSLNYQEGVDSGNAAASARQLGYKPGDTAPLENQRDLTQRYALNFAQMADNLKRQSAMDRIGAYEGIPGGLLGQGISAEGQQQQLALSRMQNPGAFFGSIMPFLGQIGQHSAPTGGGGGFSLPAIGAGSGYGGQGLYGNLSMQSPLVSGGLGGGQSQPFNLASTGNGYTLPVRA